MRSINLTKDLIHQHPTSSSLINFSLTEMPYVTSFEFRLMENNQSLHWLLFGIQIVSSSQGKYWRITFCSIVNVYISENQLASRSVFRTLSNIHLWILLDALVFIIIKLNFIEMRLSRSAKELLKHFHNYLNKLHQNCHFLIFKDKFFRTENESHNLSLKNQYKLLYDFKIRSDHCDWLCNWSRHATKY